MTYKEIIENVALSVGLPVALTDKIYKAYWRAIREHIKSLPLKDDLTDEAFLSLRPNINIPSIGKLYITLDGYKKARKKYNDLIKNKNEDNNVTH